MTGTAAGTARLIRVYGVWIALVTGIVIAAAVGVSRTGPHAYESEAIVIVEARVRANTTPVAPDMGTEKAIARSGLVIDPASRELDVSSGYLLEELAVSVAPDADVLTFAVTNPDPAVARNHAQALAEAYVYYRNSGAAASATLHATLVTGAVLPGAPVERSVWIDVGVGLALGLLLGIGTALIRDLSSDRIRGREDFERVSGTTVLASVPRLRSRRRHAGPRPVLLDSPDSPAAESFRYLRSRLQPLLRGPATILVTSAGEREGRTTTAANLAVALAQAGARVILVDADLRHPGVHTAFGKEDTLGLAEVLSGACSLTRALRETTVPRLRLLTAGPKAGTAGDLLAGHRLRGVLDSLRTQCDVIVLDSGPVLSVSDTITLAGMSDHVLLVGDQRRTTRGYVDRMVEELSEMLHDNVSGVLLNAPRAAGGRKSRGTTRPVTVAAEETPSSADAAAPAGSPAVSKPPKGRAQVSTVYGPASARADNERDVSAEEPDAEQPDEHGNARRRLTRRR